MRPKRFDLVKRSIAAVTLVVVSSCRPDPDFRSDGEAGEAPGNPGEPIYTETYSADSWVYRPPVCNRWHNIDVWATQSPVDCTTYEYGPLFSRAGETLLFRAKQVDCTKAAQECPERVVQVNSDEWTCADGSASVRMYASVRCAATPGLQNWDYPTKEELRDEGSRNHEEVPGKTGELDELPPAVQPTACPSEPYYQVVYKEKIERCAAVTSMKPHVDEARALVQRLWQSVRCPTPCRKEKFRPEADERYKWTCGEDPDGDDLITVTAELRVRCVR